MSKINVSIDCVVFGYDADLKLKVLLITKKENPTDSNDTKIHIALPGDLIKVNEDVDPAAKRILNSLTNINNIFLKRFDIFTDPNRISKLDDIKWLKNFRKNPNERVITIGYLSLINISEFKPIPSSFAHEVIWMPLDQIPELTFDHNKIIDSALNYLQNELDYKMSSCLLPENFSIPQLQKLHEEVLNKKLDSRNFRKNILRKGVLVKTKNKSKSGRTGKPATLYKFNEN